MMDHKICLVIHHKTIFDNDNMKKLKKKPISGTQKEQSLSGYLMITPWVIGFVLFQIIPIGMSIYASFTRWILVNPPPRWIGFDNFLEMFTKDKDFWFSLGLTLKYVLLSVPPAIIFGILLALLLNQKLPGMNVFRTIFYIPAVISGVAVALLWMELFNPKFGAINVFLTSLGVMNPPNWLQSIRWAVPALAIMSLWGVGGGAVIYLAGLQNIPESLYEAAELDGANKIQKFFGITLPLLSPTIFYMFITQLIASIQVFTQAYILGGTNRWGGTRQMKFFLIHLYMKAFQEGRLGYAAAMAWFLIIIAALLVLIVFKSSEKLVFYQEGE